jgi:hypothetical protein
MSASWWAGDRPYVPYSLSQPTDAIVRSVHDGDTVEFLLKLPVRAWIGRDLWADVEGRLASTVPPHGCNARELAQQGGPEARDNLASILTVGRLVTVTVIGVDKYGSRMDVAVSLPATDTAPAVPDLVTQLAADHWVAWWDGHGPRPVPEWPRTVSG